MDEREFFRTVAERTGLSREEAADLTRAALEAIARRLSEGAVGDLVLHLPDGLDATMRGVKGRPNKRSGLNEAEEQVAERTGLTREEVHAGFREVLGTLREVVPETEFDRAVDQLPGEFRRLMAEGTQEPA
ncbi:DUF2267 domain-containing protein [Pseudonocardia sp.]|jgi:uncharacterized protein (DUF2267 family)|uniref:DUF2267 domain-containing protein n=1 Tax=Pseudonocardia sp. TaxID=60912 RepID=UPI0031FBCE42